METKLKRGSGILLHITSLPGLFGIGDLGKEAYKFVNFLKRAKQMYWQILPTGEIGEENSPYKCCSAFAGNWLMISIEQLMDAGLLSFDDLPFETDYLHKEVNYEAVKVLKYKLLMTAYKKFKELPQNTLLNKEYQAFIKENKYWLDDYAAFKVAAKRFGTQNWSAWDSDIKKRNPDALKHLCAEYFDIYESSKFIQFLFFKQWKALKQYANNNGIKIIGDIPIYVDYESADVWSSPELFDLDEDLRCKNVAGVPPDYFAKNGQIWGNPLYNWKAHKDTNFDWWNKRVQFTLKMVDYLRIDHFKGFSSYYAIPARNASAANGEYFSAPGMDLLKSFQKNIPDMPIIVEDLGNVDKDLEDLRDSFSLPGMRILQLGFKNKNTSGYHPEFLPHNYVPNSIVYTGTHDTMTVKQWFEDESVDSSEIENFENYIHKKCTKEDICWEMIRLLLSSVASVAIVPLQDILELGEEGRMNYPGTLGKSWKWRYLEKDLNLRSAKKLAELTELYGRAQ